MALGKELSDMFKYLAAGKDLYECELYTKVQDSLLLMPNRINTCPKMIILAILIITSPRFTPGLLWM